MTTYNLNTLDQSQALTEAMTVASSINQPTEDYTNYLETSEIDITLAHAKSLFTIHSDSLDVTDADAVGSDFAIKLDATNWPTINVSTLTVDTADVADEDATDQSVAKNYVRQLAKDMFGTAGMADIFTNEEDLASEVTNSDTTIHDAVVADLGTDGASVAISSAGVSSELFAQKYGEATGSTAWVDDFATDFANATDNGAGVYELEFPFEEGDKLVFGVKYTRTATTLGGISKSAAELEQAYKVTLNITA